MLTGFCFVSCSLDIATYFYFYFHATLIKEFLYLLNPRSPLIYNLLLTGFPLSHTYSQYYQQLGFKEIKNKARET